jgi:NAD(P)-dependent dehydrogenase (short-subunit alcohol dehydrogenase family)
MGFGVNYLGHFRLTALLFPLLKSTVNSRIVTVSSSAHKFGKIVFGDLNADKEYKPMKAYSQSKLANLLFTFELQRKLDAAGIPVKVIASHPGWANTNPPKSRFERFFVSKMALSPAIGALPTIYAAVGENVEGGKYYGPGGFFEIRGFPKEVQPSKLALRADLAEKLWKISEELANVEYATLLATPLE